MTTQNELEVLMEACHACAETDDRSISEHFDDCPKCKDYAEKAEKLNQMVEVLELMAGKPLEARKQILGARMRKFFEMPPDQAKAAIGGLLEGLAELSEDGRNKVVKARTDLMMEIPKEHRKMLMGYLGEITNDWDPERKMMEKKAVMAATDAYFFLKKKMVRKHFAKILE